MAQKALLIGIKDGKDTLVDSGDPRDIRARFKHSDGEGFDVLEVYESTVGRSRRRSYVAKDTDAPSAPVPAVEITEPEPDETAEEAAESDEIETLITIAKGDGRKAEVKEAREKLDELGVAY
jgi:hypothetical protein